MCSIANVNEIARQIFVHVGYRTDVNCPNPRRHIIGLSTVGLHSQEAELSAFDDFDRLVLASLALKSALLRTGAIRLYSREPHRRAALGARWMNDFR